MSAPSSASAISQDIVQQPVNEPKKQAPSFTENQKKVILGTILFLSLCGIGAMVALAVPSLNILSWKISLGVSLGLAVIIGGSIYFYIKDKISIENQKELERCKAENQQKKLEEIKKEIKEHPSRLGWLFTNKLDAIIKSDAKSRKKFWATIQDCRNALESEITKGSLSRVVAHTFISVLEENFGARSDKPVNEIIDPGTKERLGAKLVNLDNEDFLEVMKAAAEAFKLEELSDKEDVEKDPSLAEIISRKSSAPEYFLGQRIKWLSKELDLIT